MAATDRSAPYADEALAINARNVTFDWEGVPLEYIPGSPYATHFWNVMHLVLPEGERAMADVFSAALPHITDERLREELVGFVGQEETHASSHESFRNYLIANGVDLKPIVKLVEHVVDIVLGDHNLKGRASHFWLCEKLAIYAAAEHFTAVVGEWLIENEKFEEVGMDETMIDLLRWHGAEEMEHRNVAYDVYQYVDGGYARRVRTALVAFSMLALLWFKTAAYLYKNDPTPQSRRPWWPLAFRKASKDGLIPGFGFLVAQIPPYLRPTFHPSQMGDIQKAVRYLAMSPAALAAQATEAGESA